MAFFAGDFVAAVFFVAVFFAAVFLAGVFFAAVFFVTFLAGAVLAGAFFAGAVVAPLRAKRPRVGRAGALTSISSHSASVSEAGSRSFGILADVHLRSEVKLR